MLSLILLYVVLGLGVLITPLGFPGTWLMWAAVVIYSLVGSIHPSGSDLPALIVVTTLAVVGELLEFGVRIVGSKFAKVPTGAIVAAMFGGFIGAIVGVPIFLIGSLLGLLLGIFLGAFTYALATGHSASAASGIALATTLSQLIALFAKTCLALGILLYVTTCLF